tara:strand:- start:4585 stop:4935 length:351 start_codon:yes stop_codon:yes gene_type:complete
MNTINNEQKCLTNCSHNFCYDCLSRWLSINNKCPNCREDIETFKYKDEINRIFTIHNIEDIENINHNITELRGMLNNVNYHNNRINKLLICLKSMTGLSILFFMSSLYLIIECDEI